MLRGLQLRGFGHVGFKWFGGGWVEELMAHSEGDSGLFSGFGRDLGLLIGLQAFQILAKAAGHFVPAAFPNLQPETLNPICLHPSPKPQTLDP